MKTITLNDDDYLELLNLFEKEIGDMRVRKIELESTGRESISEVLLDKINKLEQLKEKVVSAESTGL